MSAIPVLIRYDTFGYHAIGVYLYIDEMTFLLNRDKILADMISLSKEFQGVLELVEKTSIFGNTSFLIRISFSGESNNTALSYFIRTLQLEDYKLTSYFDYNGSE